VARHRNLTVFLIILSSLSFGMGWNDGSFGQSAIFNPDKILSLDFVDTDLNDALRLLASQNNINIVTNEDIRGVVTVHFTKVTLKGAIDAILKANGYDYIIQENILIIKPTAMVIHGELTSKIFELDYVSAEDLQLPLQNILSPKGKLEVFTRSSSLQSGAGIGPSKADILVVSDIPDNMMKITEFIEKIDVEAAQVMISVKFIETSLTENLKLGIDWSMSAILSGGPAVAQPTGLASGGGGLPGLGIGAFKDLNLAILSMSEFQIVLDMLQSTGRSELLSEPRITTLDNQWANMSVETEITVIVPVVAGGAAGAIAAEQAQKVTVEIALAVLPQVHKNGQITLAVEPTVEAITGYSGPDLDQPIISRRTTSTQVRVKNGETIAIGGLIKEDLRKVEKKVPILGSIPILGKMLFTTTSDEKERSDLLIFITPHIINPED